MQIGKKIKILRELKNLTQEYVSSKLDITQPAYSKIENDATEITVSQLEEIAQIFGVRAEAIIGFDTESFVLDLSHSKKSTGIVINSQLSQDERAVYLDYIQNLKDQISDLKSKKYIIPKSQKNKP